MSVFLLDMREAKKRPDASAQDRRHDQPQHLRGVLRQRRDPGDTLVGEEGKGFRYIVDSMNAERILIASECIGDAKFFIDKAVDYANERGGLRRPIGANQGIQFPIAKAYAEAQAAELMVSEGSRAVRRRPEGGGGGQHGQAAGGRCLVEGGGGLHAGPWRLRLRPRIRHRAQVARGPALPDGADLQEHDPTAISASMCWACRAAIEGDPVRIHPQDAAARGISDGDVVELFNQHSRCLAAGHVTNDVVAGTVFLWTGPGTIRTLTHQTIGTVMATRRS
jgi:alkylation response protein AidB-like acyl-CoA dehydrogenase